MILLLSVILVSLLNLFLGFIVIKKNPKNEINIIFFLLIIFVVGWVITNYLTDFVGAYNLALLFGKSTFFTSLTISYLFFYFCFIFPTYIIENSNAKLFLKFLALPTLIVLILSFSNKIVSGVTLEGQTTQIIYGNIFWSFELLFLTFILGGLGLLIFKFFRGRGRVREQIFFVLLGFGFSAILATFTNLIFPLLTGSHALSKFGFLPTIFLIGFISYAILAHHLFDIRVIIKRAVVYSTLLAFVLVTYSFVVFIFTQIFGQGATTQTLFTARAFFPNIIAAVLIALGFGRLESWLSAATDRWLFKGEYIPEQVLAELSDKMRNVTDLDEALNSMMQTITKALRVKKAATFVIQKIENTLEVKRMKAVGYTSFQSLELKPDDYLIHYFDNKKDKKIKATLVEGLKRELEENQPPKISLYQEPSELEKMIKHLEEMKAAVVIPLYIAREMPIPSAPGTPTKYQKIEQLIGLFTLGEKLSGDIFSSRDINLLEIAANQTASAVEKARFFEEDQLKTEFVSIASHELLTPTATMMGYLSMILDEGIGKVDARARDYLSKVFNSSKRLSELVKELLSVSRIERGKIQINAVKMDIIPLVEQTIDDLQIKAKEKKMEILLKARDGKVKKDGLQVWADGSKLTEVLFNLIGNAIKYSLAGTVTVEVFKDASFATISVTDTGIGIPKKDLSRLFEKFFRATNSDKTGASGTGLGLYITKSIIELMGGRIWAESTEGKGSTFYFTLPLAK